ncbi:MAG TPA: PTS sugar transporter subunit IIA [Thermoanaerobaculia bacterium]|nr:PTS sugar transporter subunit IIA [Thermoanaerobaculia bacterium]
MVDTRNKKPAPDPKSMMTVAEVSNYLSLSAGTVYKLVGDLRAVRIGGRWCFRTADVEQWLLKRRSAGEPPIEPVQELGSHVRLIPHLDETNIFLDVSDSDAPTLIANAVRRARLDLTESPKEAAKERIIASILEREALCSTALHPDVAFPHPRDPEKCPLGRDHIVVVRAAKPVEFGEIHGHRPRIVFVLLARTVSLQLHWEARLSHLLHREDFVEKALSAKSAREFRELFGPAPRTSDA